MFTGLVEEYSEEFTKVFEEMLFLLDKKENLLMVALTNVSCFFSVKILAPTIIVRTGNLG